MKPLITLRHADTLKLISGPLRLAAKYDMDSVAHELTPVLERDWPRTYDDWVFGERGFQLRLRNHIPVPREHYQDPGSVPVLPSPVSNPDESLAAAIRLAMDVRLRSVLPAAFYELSQISIREPLHVGPYDRWADAKLLSGEDMERLIVGRERIARYLADVVFNDE